MAVLEYGFIQAAARLVPGDICVEFPNHTRLLVSPRMKGAAHYIAPRLCEFEEMAFVMHFLRPGELFVDVGANVGVSRSWRQGWPAPKLGRLSRIPTRLRCSCATSVSMGFRTGVKPVRAAVGQSEGTIQLTTDLGRKTT